MVKITGAFSGFSVDDQAKAKEFYGNVLDLEIADDAMGLHVRLASGTNVFIYEKPDHQPATFTVLNLQVKDINAAIDELMRKGVSFEHYNNLPAEQDERGVLRGLAANMGPDIAWLKDPAGNILAVLQEA